MGAPNVSSRSQAGAKPSESEEATLSMAQELWGQGHLSPLEEILESQALVSLPLGKASKVAVVAPFLGHRLQRYSKEKGLWIDAFESDLGLARFVREKGTKASFKAWSGDQPGLLGTSRFTEVLVFRPSLICEDLPLLYSETAKSLRAGGRIFVGDLASSSKRPFPPGTRPMPDHLNAMKGAGLMPGPEVDLSRELNLKIRRAFLKSTEKLPDLRALQEPLKARALAAYFAELGQWAAVATVIEAARLTVFGLVAARQD